MSDASRKAKETRPAPYSPVHVRGIRAICLYLKSKEDTGIIFDLSFEAMHRHGQLHYNTHFRTHTDIVVPEIKRIACEHDLTLKWLTQQPPHLADEEMSVRVSIVLLSGTPIPMSSDMMEEVNRWEINNI